MSVRLLSSYCAAAATAAAAVAVETAPAACLPATRALLCGVLWMSAVLLTVRGRAWMARRDLVREVTIAAGCAPAQGPPSTLAYNPFGLLPTQPPRGCGELAASHAVPPCAVSTYCADLAIGRRLGPFPPPSSPPPPPPAAAAKPIGL